MHRKSSRSRMPNECNRRRKSQRVESRSKIQAPSILNEIIRHVFSSSSCGVCGKASIERCDSNSRRLHSTRRISGRRCYQHFQMPSRQRRIPLRNRGSAPARLFDWNGKLIALREDVGRHNALDKLIGHALLQNHLPLREHILLLSGRFFVRDDAKALAAGIPWWRRSSAPSSLAGRIRP